MIISEKQKIEINKYFKDFVTKYKEAALFKEDTEDTDYTIKEIINKNEINFYSNWNHMMVLVLIIEKIYNIEEIISHKNYVRFRFEAENEIIQDKGDSKLEAYYLVCFKTLKKFWKEGKTTVSYKNTEPFDETDLK